MTPRAAAARSKPCRHKTSETAIVDQVTVIGTASKGLQRANIKTRLNRNPVIGDKFSSRHGQKGVLSVLWKDHDMPYCETTGMRYVKHHDAISSLSTQHVLSSSCNDPGALSRVESCGTCIIKALPWVHTPLSPVTQFMLHAHCLVWAASFPLQGQTPPHTHTCVSTVAVWAYLVLTG